MQIVGFSVRLSSSFLWIQIYRLGLSYVDTSALPREADFDLRNSFLSPTTPVVPRQTSDSSDALGGSIYDPAYYSSLFEDGQVCPLSLSIFLPIYLSLALHPLTLHTYSTLHFSLLFSCIYTLCHRLIFFVRLLPSSLSNNTLTNLPWSILFFDFCKFFFRKATKFYTFALYICLEFHTIHDSLKFTRSKKDINEICHHLFPFTYCSKTSF